jgi:hypothetical protein
VRANTPGASLFELILLAALWMLFGFMMWYYLSAFHGIPVRLVSNAILSALLDDSYYNIIANPDRMYLFQVQTRIPFEFPDGSVGALGFIVNPLIYSWGLPVLFGLEMGVEASWRRKIITLMIGTFAIFTVQVWGVVWETLKELAFTFGGSAGQVVANAGISPELIALCYQLGVLILPPLVPVFIWVIANWSEVERYAGWHPEASS